MSTFVVLLKSVGAITAISTVLAVLMVIADATIANYGNVSIDINGKRSLTVRGGRPLLSTLMSEGIFIPSACGGRGSCGLCKVMVPSGGSKILPTELPWLSDEEKTADVRLSCQLKVKENLVLKIPEELFNVREYSATVESIRDLTYDIKEVRLRLKDPPDILIRAGQFVQLKVPEYELTDEPVYRAYSVASAPSETGCVELEIRLVPQGICTTYVHKYMKKGDTVSLNGPYGEFYLHDSGRELVFIAGGSGMAPIKSILNDMSERGDTRKATYFFGARSKRDLFLLEQMALLEKKLAAFRFIPALSEPQPDDNWEGETGLVTEVLARHLPAGADVEAYLCGSPGMIDACVAVLTSRGVPREFIFYDKFA